MREQRHEATGEDIDLAEAAIGPGQGGHGVRAGGQAGDVLHPVRARGLQGQKYHQPRDGMRKLFEPCKQGTKQVSSES